MVQAVNLSYQGSLLAGVDEAGRGPLVGAVVAAAVILDPKQTIIGLQDSKKLTEKKREYLFDEICQKALCYHIAEASADEIDSINILQATMIAMKRAVEGLKVSPEFAAIDGNRCPELTMPCQAIIKGDQLLPAISAASILAKVYRDNLMRELAMAYPHYGFERHKGYPTKLHLEKLKQYGVLAQHRKSFKPVANILATS